MVEGNDAGLNWRTVESPRCSRLGSETISSPPTSPTVRRWISAPTMASPLHFLTEMKRFEIASSPTKTQFIHVFLSTGLYQPHAPPSSYIFSHSPCPPTTIGLGRYEREMRKSNPTRSSCQAPSGTSCTWYLRDHCVSRHRALEAALTPLREGSGVQEKARLTSRGADQESVVRVEHVLGVRALEREKRILVRLL